MSDVSIVHDKHRTQMYYLCMSVMINQCVDYYKKVVLQIMFGKIIIR